MTTELKPCPFCGSDEISLDDQEFPQHVICDNCSCYGPEGHELIDVVEKWNAATRNSYASILFDGDKEVGQMSDLAHPAY